MNVRRRSAAEVIGFHIGWDIRDVSDCRYQAGRTSCAVYAIGDCYMCAPPAGQPPPNGWHWIPEPAQVYFRTVYVSKI